MLSGAKVNAFSKIGRARRAILGHQRLGHRVSNMPSVGPALSSRSAWVSVAVTTQRGEVTFAADVGAVRRLAEHTFVEKMRVGEVFRRHGALNHQVGELDRSVVVVRAELQVLLHVKDGLVRPAFFGRGVRLPQQRLRDAGGLDRVKHGEPATEDDSHDEEAQEQFAVEGRHGSPVLERRDISANQPS